MSDKKLKVNAHLSVGRRKSSVVARRIVFLFLSLVFSISVILAVIFLVNIAGITQSNLHDTAELTMRYLNIDVQNAILPAMEVTKIAASIAPNLDYSEISPYFLEMMNVVPAVGELYYGTTLSRFDGGIFITATGVDVYGMYPEWDQVTRDWMTHAVKQPNDLVFIDPYVDTATGQLCITMSKAVIDNSKIIGVVGTDVFLDVLTQIVTSRKITSDGNTFIIDKDGLILVHEEQENVLTNNFFEGKNKDFCDKFLSGLQVTVIGNTYWASMPVTGLDWIMVTTGSTEEFDSDFWHILRLVIILAIVVAVISSVVAVLFSRSLVNPIIQLFSVLKAISTGDFTQHIEAKNKKDEVSQMTMLLKETQEGIKNLIIRIKKEAENLSLIGNDLASDM
ncbi:MAG: methyl-accepting chemotaxis protein, partial [Treponema sp.]|nr:methyl-accepting chemotaxis protein [Treponema sp.]